MNHNNFFQTDEIQNLLTSAIYSINKSKEVKQRRLHSALKIIKSHANQFDENCQCNIDWIGENLRSDLSKISSSQQKEEEEEKDLIDELYSSIYRFLLEFNLKNNFELSPELNSFISYAQDRIDDFNSIAKEQIIYASKWMHISITKKVLHNPNIEKFFEYSKKYEEINNRIDSWDKELEKKEKLVEALSLQLKKYETAFNFVGLYQGFDDLHKTKIQEYFWNRTISFILAISALIPTGLKIYIDSEKEIESTFSLSSLYGLIPYIAVTFLILYFFRISYRVMDNTKSQILQIEIRKALCQFIQNYTDFSSEASKKSPETLKKFESIIFSNIVGTQEKIPSTFDGIDTINNLIRSANNK
ncbi:MAG: hypothetical protein KA964_05310 [Comamonas sp.]|nr:hypothetical protein [Comamonas sp.]